MQTKIHSFYFSTKQYVMDARVLTGAWYFIQMSLTGAWYFIQMSLTGAWYFIQMCLTGAWLFHTNFLNRSLVFHILFLYTRYSKCFIVIYRTLVNEAFRIPCVEKHNVPRCRVHNLLLFMAFTGYCDHNILEMLKIRMR